MVLRARVLHRHQTYGFGLGRFTIWVTGTAQHYTRGGTYRRARCHPPTPRRSPCIHRGAPGCPSHGGTLQHQGTRRANDHVFILELRFAAARHRRDVANSRFVSDERARRSAETRKTLSEKLRSRRAACTTDYMRRDHTRTVVPSVDGHRL